MVALPGDLDRRLSDAVKSFWEKRIEQDQKQKQDGKKDQGTRSAVTGGAQMDGFIKLIRDLIISTGISNIDIFYNKAIELPGYYRPTKE